MMKKIIVTDWSTKERWMGLPPILKIESWEKLKKWCEGKEVNILLKIMVVDTIDTIPF